MQTDYQAAMATWHAYQERARKRTLAFNKHRDRNAKKRARNAPGKDIKTGYSESYYEGGHRMVIDGTPVRVAAHVKKWKATNRAALCDGFQPYGLVTNAPTKPKGWTAEQSYRLEARFAGDLFHCDDAWREQVACEAIGAALKRSHWYSDYHHAADIFIFESDVARSIGKALQEFGFSHTPWTGWPKQSWLEAA